MIALRNQINQRQPSFADLVDGAAPALPPEGALS
jgi:hypothetical protein